MIISLSTVQMTGQPLARRDASDTNILNAYLTPEVEKAQAQKLKALDTIKRVAERVTDPARQAEEARAAAMREIAKAEQELQALRLLSTIDPEAAAKAAERILDRIDRALAAYSSAVSSAYGAGGAATSKGQSAKEAATSFKASLEAALNPPQTASVPADAAPKGTTQAPEAPKNPSEKSATAAPKAPEDEAESRKARLDELNAGHAARKAYFAEQEAHEDLIAKARSVAEQAMAIIESAESTPEEKRKARATLDSIDANIRVASSAMSARPMPAPVSTSFDIRV